MFVYCITNLITGDRYIGITTQSLSTRWSEHVSRSRFNYYKSKVHSAIRKYGASNFKIEHIASATSLEDLKKTEIALIAQYNTFIDGYNLTTGGGYKIISEEVKRKISNSKLGHSVSTETREKLAEFNRRNWKIIYGDGQETSISNLKQFCIDNKISYSHITKRKTMKKLNIIKVEAAY